MTEKEIINFALDDRPYGPSPAVVWLAGVVVFLGSLGIGWLLYLLYKIL